MRQPTLSYWTWSRTVPQFVTMFLLIVLFWWLLPPELKTLCIFCGGVVYLAYSKLSRRVVASKHWLGARHMAEKEYDDAILKFREGIDFFDRHKWLDKYRAFFLMCPSAWSYRETGLMNIASVYMSQGKVEEAIRTFTELLDEHPGNEVARNTLEFIRAASGDDET